MTHMIYLVNNRKQFLDYTEQFKLFNDKDNAIAYAKSIGYLDEFGVGISDQVGMAHYYSCGDVNIMIIPLLGVEDEN